MFDHFELPAWTEKTHDFQLLDVSLRDGGFEVDFSWAAEHLLEVPRVLGRLDVEWCELGYIGGVPGMHGVNSAGLTANIQPDHVQLAHHESIRLAAMVHPSALQQPINFDSYRRAGLQMVRVVYHPSWERSVMNLVEKVQSVGMKVSLNIALASRYSPSEFLTIVSRFQRSASPDIVYIADTCGAMKPTQVGNLVRQTANVSGAERGFHAHDFLGLAHANALAAADEGARYIDASILGLGRGGGNLVMETMLFTQRLSSLTPLNALATFLALRLRLGEDAGHHVANLVPSICAALNLTPAEEAALIATAARNGSSEIAEAAMLLRASRGTSALFEEVEPK